MTTRRRARVAPGVATPHDGNLSLLDALIAADGLPPAVPEHRPLPPRRWRIDRAWPEHGMVACEVEGAVWTQGRHTRGSGFIGDIEKYNELALAGWLLVRVTYAMIADGSAVAVIRRALAARQPQQRVRRHGSGAA